MTDSTELIAAEKPKQKWHRLSEQQRNFLRALYGRPVTLSAVQKRMKIDSPTLHRWLKSKQFRKALRVVVRELRRRRWLAIEVCSLRACERIAQMIASKKPNIARLASMDMMRLTVMSARRARPNRAATRPRRAAIAPPALADAPLELPSDLSPQDAERLLTELERSREKPAQ